MPETLFFALTLLAGALIAIGVLMLHLSRPRTEAQWLTYLDRHIATCKTCHRDAEGWAQWPDMCETGQRIVQGMLDAP